jgi:inorganic pyrophosphatase/exopolyphosphatase
LRDEYDVFWVVDENGQYVGIARQRDILNPPRLKIILVDHNEPSQALGALEEAELLEILDHHRLGNPHTHTPIRFTVDIVGSTSTLVSEQTSEAGLSMPPALAGTLLAGLLADTLVLTSPTTTLRDKQAAERLARWAFVGGSPLRGETIESYGKSVLSAGAGLSNRKPEEIVSTDIKPYEAGGYKLVIAQAEVTDLVQLAEHLGPLTKALNDLRDKRGLDFAMLLITDVVRGSSRLILSSNPPPILTDLPYPPLPDGTRDAPGVVSRKKQLLPELEKKNESAALCTVVKSEGSTPRHVGSKMLVYPDGKFIGTVGGGDLEHRVLDEAWMALGDGQARLLEYNMADPARGDPGVCGGTVEVFVEPILPAAMIVVIGAGHVGKAVAHLAKWLGFPRGSQR